MEPEEFCKMKYGYCACSGGEIMCDQILRLSADEREVAEAYRLRQIEDRKRTSRYIMDEPPRRGFLYGEMIEAMMRRPEFTALASYDWPDKMPKTEIRKYSIADAAMDFSSLEKRIVSVYEKTVPLEPVKMRRLGSSDKSYVALMDDPVRKRR